MEVWQMKLPDGRAHDHVTQFLEGKWAVSRNGAVIAWFAYESDARAFAGE
jgi:hypothetical protein